MTDLVLFEIGILGTGISRKMGRMQVEQGFSLFFSIFLPNLMIFQSFAVPLACSTLKNHQIWQKMKKGRVPLSLNPYFHSISETRNLGFQYPTIHQPSCRYIIFSDYVSYKLTQICHCEKNGNLKSLKITFFAAFDFNFSP